MKNRSCERQAVLYARVASVSQHNEDAFDARLARCSDYAVAKNYQVVGRFVDHASGLSADRPQLKSMLKFLRSRRNVVVVIDDLAGLARDIRTYYELRRSICKAGGSIEFAGDLT
jgi:DNA invertase Pin-like site-specific DNA recombinase